jgi:hypothetical protein
MRITTSTTLVALATIICIACSDESSVGRVTSYHFHVVQKAESYFARLDFAVADTTSGAILDGMVTEYDPARVFFGYDTSMIEFDGDRIIPIRVGSTTIYVRHPNPQTSTIVDSVTVTVQKLNGKFIIEAQSPAYPAAPTNRKGTVESVESGTS